MCPSFGKLRDCNVKKSSKNKIAVTYASALYDAASEAKAETKVFADVEKLSALLAQDDELLRYMANPMFGDKDKTDVLKQLASKLQWADDTLRCLEIVSENRRFRELPQILNEFVHVYYARHNIAEVVVESVKKLSVAQDKKLQSHLEKFLNKKIVVSYKIAPELIGGLRIKFGSEMIDDSILSKLNHLENVMKGVQ